MATPSLAMIPSAYADSKVYSVLPNNGDGDFTFNRDSSATRVGQNGLIQTVGYFGSELVTNGTFDTNLNNWNVTLAGQTIEWDNGKVKYISDGALAFLNQDITTVVGKVYRVTVDINVIIGNLGITIGGQDVFGDGIQTLEMLFTATSTTSTFGLKRKPGAAANGTFDNATFKEVTGDQPRLNYDVNNGAVQSCPSLLLEPASTNFLPESNNYSDSVWSKQSGGTASVPVVTSNYSISPDGTKNADRVVFNLNGGTTSSDFSQLAESVTTSVGDVSNSVYIKSNTSANYVMSFIKPDGSAASITVTQEWQRFSSTFTLTGTTSVFKLRLRGSESTADYADVSIYGAQTEEQLYATSLIPTYGTIQTRAAETCFGAGTVSTFNDSEGVLYAEIESFISQDTVDPNRYITITNGTSSERIALLLGGNSNQLRAIIFSSSQSINLSFTTSLTEVKQFNKLAVRYKSGDYAFYLNGVEIGSSTESNIFSSNTLNNLSFNVGGGTQPFYGKCKDLRVYNEALTDAQLQTLTT